MPDSPDQTIEIQASADLSPVSPSPVHGAPPVVVSALQDRADTIEAMTAAMSDAIDAAVEMVDAAAAGPQETADNMGHMPDGVDNLDLYDQGRQPSHAQDQEEENHNPGPDQNAPSVPAVADAEAHQPISQTAQSMPVSAPEFLPASPSVDAESSVPFTEPEPATEVSIPEPTLSDAPAEANPEPSPTEQPSTAPESAEAAQSTVEPSPDTQQLVTEIAAQTSSASAESGAAPPKMETPSATGISVAPAATSSLPPRPPLPESTAQFYDRTEEMAQAHAPASVPPMMMVPGQGQLPSYGAPGVSPVGGLSNPAVGAPLPVTSINPQDAASAPYSADAPKSDSGSDGWAQFMGDERKYMTEAKWDRFPEGSRIFIGMSCVSCLGCH